MQADIEQIASRYSHLAEAFTHIPEGARHLQRLQDLNTSWQNMLCTNTPRSYGEVVVTEARSAVPASNTLISSARSAVCSIQTLSLLEIIHAITVRQNGSSNSRSNIPTCWVASGDMARVNASTRINP
ncbi:MAG TPA: hypothetical protein VN207_13770 [Ktedonobacteraceae bacterium]|nr:hypothetical protein [Ktedonobacteraceae bacterium]